MAKIVVMPKLGLTMTEGAVSRWLKKEGDPVSVGEALFEVETDKLTNTIEATQAGVLRRIVVPQGSTVPCLAPVAVIGAPDEDISGLLPAPTADTSGMPAHTPSPRTDAPATAEKAVATRVIASPAAKKLAKELGIDIALVPGHGPKGRVTEEDVTNYKKTIPEPSEDADTKASPLASKLAADLNVELSDVPSKGRVLAQDILAYVENAAACGGTKQPREERVPMNGMRRTIAKNMLNSHLTSPTVTFNLSVDMSALKAGREQLKNGELKVSYTDLLVKITAKALTEFPLLNCSVEDNEILYKHYVNMGVAVALDNGLVVPNIRDADRKGLKEISEELKDLAAAARNGTLPMDRLSGGTFTITNLGMYGIESFSPIINQPEVAILGVTTMEDRVVVRNGEPAVRPMMTLSLTADHRVVDGSVAAQFLQRIKTLMENPLLMLA